MQCTLADGVRTAAANLILLLHGGQRWQSQEEKYYLAAGQPLSERWQTGTAFRTNTRMGEHHHQKQRRGPWTRDNTQQHSRSPGAGQRMTAHVEMVSQVVSASGTGEAGAWAWFITTVHMGILFF